MPSTPSETSALLPNGSNGSRPESSSFSHRAVALLKAEGEPSWVQSYKFFVFGSYLNVLLIFVPLSAVSHYLNWDAGLRFLFSFIAIVPLAKVIILTASEMWRAHTGNWMCSCSGKLRNRCLLSLGRLWLVYLTHPSVMPSRL